MKITSGGVACAVRGGRAGAVVACMVAASGASASWFFTNLHPPIATSHSVANHVFGNEQVGWAGAGTWRGGYWNGTANSFVDLTPFNAGANASFVWGTHNGQQTGRVSYDGGFTWQAGVWSGTPNSFVNMHPQGWAESRSHSVQNGQQAGYVQNQNGSVVHAALWSGTAGSFVDLHPSGATWSTAWAVHGGQQGGEAIIGGSQRAALWSGTAGSFVDLTPGGAVSAWVRGMAAGQQVGDAYIGGIQHAALWSGSAGSFVDLNPAGASSSFAWGVFGGYQVGTSIIGGAGRATIWNGSAASAIDLHQFIPNNLSPISSDARGVWVDGFGNITVVGEFHGSDFISRAAMWQFVVPAPGTSAALVLAGLVAARRRRRA